MLKNLTRRHLMDATINFDGTLTHTHTHIDIIYIVFKMITPLYRGLKKKTKKLNSQNT